MKQHQLPAGLTNSNGELFYSNEDKNLHLLQGRRILAFEEFSSGLLSTLEYKLLSIPARHTAVMEMVQGAGRTAEIKQLAICLYGGFDLRPDLVDGEPTEAEFWPCPERGKCRFEGIICGGLKLANGLFLTRREIAIIQLVAIGFLDKMIASDLKISLHTVASHNKNIREKTGLRRKADITRFAVERHLI